MARAEPGGAPPRLTLVSGPARSGKSRWAEHLAATSGRRVVYLATGPRRPHDPSWQERVARHRRRRPTGWTCREVGGCLAEALPALDDDQFALVDSLGTWVAAHLELGLPEWERQLRDLLAAVEDCPAQVLLVCEETGWGVVPPTELGGRFRDRLGELQQRLLGRCDAAWLVLQGRAVDLLAISHPVPPAP
ncbi:MAG: bifunctional adenosylcobinamide kinase/adenosylcobinamide-phosphate guanylyltransferase [Synechococcaceae cyanobacterium]|nr:bifunctional adenosylcobinamide kinase/adenosylcobinamide-phosphate guanylyltransferase [Synechococcaceae cyanobacterium]